MRSRIKRQRLTIHFSPHVTALLGNPKGPVELGHPNTCAEVKLCLFLFIPAQEIVCSEVKVLKQLVLAKLRAAISE